MTLWPHQEAGVEAALRDIAAHGGHALLFEQRTGKSRTAIETARRLGAMRVLVLCPSQAGAVPKVWVREFAEQWPGSPRVVNLTGTGVERARTLAALRGQPAVVVCNYESACRAPLGPRFGKRGKIEDVGALAALDWDVLICDEMHRLKDPSGQWQRAATLIADRTPARLGLTGTPMHSPLDIWGQFRIVDRTVFGPSYVQWRMAHLRPALKSEFRDPDVEYLQTRMGPQRYKIIGLDDIEAKMHSRSSRVLAEDVFPDMPPALDDVRTVPLEPAARRIYRDLERTMVAELAGDQVVTASNAGVKVLRLMQLTGGALTPLAFDPADCTEPQVVSTAKEGLLREVLEGLEGEPCVVFGRFHTDLDAIHRACEAVGLPRQPELSGRPGGHDGLEPWQAGEGQVLVTQIQAGGVGISLVRASTVIYYNPGRSLIDYTQSRSRVLGPLQHKPALFLHLLCEGTVDETAYAALRDRRDVVASVVDRLRGQG